MINFVAAHDKNLGIGYKQKLPWPLMPADKAYLHLLTKGKKLVMGEKTYRNYKSVQQAFETHNVTVLSNSVHKLTDAVVVNSIDDILERAKTEELWVIGGGDVFKQLFPYVNTMYITVVQATFKADTYFPKYQVKDWNVVKQQTFNADTANPYPYTFITLKKPT